MLSHIAQYGLIGYPLSHSFSPAYFSQKFSREGIAASYTPYPLEDIAGFPALVQAHPALKGLNVTTPHKQSVIPFLHALDHDAKSIGSVNCIAIREGRLTGHNTDWLGFRDSIGPLLKPDHITALILGNGGAAPAIRYALSKLHITHHTVSRTKETADFTYDELTPSVVQQHTIIINTTTLGTQGIGEPDIPYSAITSQHLLYDLVYNPALTPFLSKGQLQGATIKNGEEMLHLQAEASWRIWQQQ